MNSKSIAERVLAEALTTGGDFSELVMEDTRQMGIMLMDGMIDSASTSRRHGAGIRVYKKLESVYVHTFDTSEAGLMRVARQAADAIGEDTADRRPLYCSDARTAGTLLPHEDHSP